MTATSTNIFIKFHCVFACLVRYFNSFFFVYLDIDHIYILVHFKHYVTLNNSKLFLKHKFKIYKILNAILKANADFLIKEN